MAFPGKDNEWGAMVTIPEIKVHFSIQHTDIPSYLAKTFFIILKRSRRPREAKFAYNPDLHSLNYRLVNARNGEFNLNDSKDLLDACARGFSEHPQQPKAAPALAFSDVYLQCRNRCHGLVGADVGPLHIRAPSEGRTGPWTTAA
jgi:hypothetical protein